MRTDQRQETLRLAEDAETALLEEYGVLHQTYEKNPTMAAIARGVHAIRALRAEVETSA